MLSGLGIGPSYAIYGGLNALAAAFCRRRMVETKRRRLEDIRAELVGSEE